VKFTSRQSGGGIQGRLLMSLPVRTAYQRSYNVNNMLDVYKTTFNAWDDVRQGVRSALAEAISPAESSIAVTPRNAFPLSPQPSPAVLATTGLVTRR